MKPIKKKNPRSVSVNTRQPTMLMARVKSKMRVDKEKLAMKKADTLGGLIFRALVEYVEGRWNP